WKLVDRLPRPLDDTSLAVIVERSHPGFADSLSTAIELAGRSDEAISPELLARTAAEAVANLEAVRPDRIFRRRPLVMLAFAAALAFASVVGFACAQPAAAALFVRRMMLLGDEPWPRRVELDVADFPGGVRKVARGSDVDVVVHARSADRIPDLVDVRWRATGTRATPFGGARTSWRTERMGTRGGETATGQVFGHVLKGVTEDLDVEIRGGDARVRNLRVEVLEPPALEQLTISWEPPAYMGRGRRESPASRVVQIPRGSAVEIACVATKPLSAASVTAVAVGAAQAAEEVLASIEPEAAAETTRRAERGITARIEALDADRAIVVRFTDADGLDNREPVTFVLSAIADEPPTVAVRLLGISTAVTPRARVPLVGTISDDHGLGAATVRLRLGEGDERMLPVARVRPGDAVVELPATAAEVVALESQSLAPGRKLEIVLTAEDACTLAGGPNVGSGDTWTLDVVTPEALTAMLEAREIILRRRYEGCVNDLSQARDAFAAPAAAPVGDEGGDRADPMAALGEATARATGETAEIAEAFRAIRLEFANNQLITPELEARLITQIADPLAALAGGDLPGLAAACRGGEDRAAVLRRTDDVLARMRAVLGKMLELESFNEVVEMLRGMIRSQEQLRSETLEQQKKRAREALERP
ncbi:MAG: hypothetical protein ACKOTB_10045, partial [Planctomycetia bacterium]